MSDLSFSLQVIKYTNFNVVWKKDPMFQSWLLEDPASKRNFKCKVCQSTLELGNMGKGAVVKHSKSVKHVQNSESRKSSAAAMLSFWTGNKNLQTSKLHNNVTDSSSENMVNHDFSESNPEVTIDPAPPSPPKLES